MAIDAKPLRFGFLTEKVDVTFSHGSIVPLPDFDLRMGIISKAFHKDGYLYPPLEISNDFENENENAKKAQRPFSMYQIPASHELIISPDEPEKNLREESAGFIVNLLALLFKTRLQFEDWFIDGRIPISVIGRDPHLTYPQVVENRLSSAYKVWSDWESSSQLLFGNILYMFLRSVIYQRDWEKFLFQYIILDACWNLGKELFGFTADGHGKRITELYNHFGVNHSEFLDAKKILSLRKELFHEAKWADGRPGHTTLSRTLGYCPGGRLQWINEYLICCFLQLPRLD